MSRRRRTQRRATAIPLGRSLAAALAITVALISACSSGGSPDSSGTTPATSPPSITATTTPSGDQVPTTFNDVASGPKPPQKGAWIGAWVKPAVMSQSGRIAAVEAFERQLTRPLDVVHVYHDWDEAFPTDSDRHYASQGSVVLLSWSGTDTRAIQSGRYDDLIRRDAEALKGWGADVLLEWRWEMDRPNLSGQVWSAQDYIAAWKHIRAIFAKVDVPNVGWVWCPLAVGFDTNRAQPFYPGDDQVDWICADVYPGKDIKPFATGAGSFLTWAKDHPKPIIIGEFGMKEERGETKRQDWLKALRVYAKTQPQIKGLVYFNADNSDAAKSYNMDLLSSPGSLSAFRDLATDPYFDLRLR